MVKINGCTKCLLWLLDAKSLSDRHFPVEPFFCCVDYCSDILFYCFGGRFFFVVLFGGNEIKGT